MKSSLAIVFVLVGGTCIAQTPPTATEAFALRIKCKEMADQKGESMWQFNPLLKYQPEIILRYVSSKYDPKFNHCYIEVFDHYKVAGPKPFEIQNRGIYDAQTDDLLAFAKIQNGVKSGMVFDREHQATIPGNLGWDDANAYIDEMMAEKRR